MIISGIYKIYFQNSSKLYIGSSKDICRRWSNHLNDLRKNKHCNKHLQNAYNKYGYYNIQFEIVKTIDFIDRKTLLYEEQLVLNNLLKADSDKKYFLDNSYNLSTICLGSNQVYKNTRRVSVFNLNMDFIEEIEGVREVERIYNLQGIHKCCKGQRSRVGNYIFKYSDELNIEFITKKGEGYRKGEKRKNVKPIAQYDFKSKEFIKNWRCAEEASKELDLYDGGISRVLSGKYSNIKGFYFKYI